MGYIAEGFRHAAELLFPPKKEIIEIVLLSLGISSSATLIAAAAAIPLGVAISLKNFAGRRILVGILNAWLAIPAVAIGLVVYGLVSRRGPLGFLELLFTPYAVIIAQAALAFPILLALTVAALKNIARDTRDLARSLGASRFQTAAAVVREGRFAFLSAIIMGFSRVIGETGMTLMIGGNIKGETRVMTTAIALETMKGNFETGVALGVVLVATALLANIFLQAAQGK